MRKTPTYKTIFDQTYSGSPPEVRALFNDPNTREQAGELYNAWRICEKHRQKYQTGQLRRRAKSIRPRKKIIDFEAEARASVGRELNDLVWLAETLNQI